MSELKYGPINTERLTAVVATVTAGEVIKAKSGRFVTLTTSTGCVEIADAADTVLGGFIEAGETASSASGLKVLMYPAAANAGVYRIPVITGTLTAAMIGQTCDLVRSSGVQGADLTASTTDVLKIVGGDLVGNKYVDVMITPAKVAAGTGVV